VNLGIALSRRQRLDEALDQFQAALRLDPANAVARKHLEAIQAQRVNKP
jgi:tetratricopeptide (TPR) repeat protein